MFSSRLPPVLAANALTRALADLGPDRAHVLDLTETNPTAVGLAYPDDILSALAQPRAGRYQPDPRGLFDARQAVAAQYASRWHAVGADQVVLTSSTSEAYAWLFKLLCNPGDNVLVPQPSYPLFEMLTDLEGVRAVPYRLDGSDGWCLDRAGLEAALSPRSRAILIVSPNNPTGSMIQASDRDWLVALAARRGLAIIADEVFVDYQWHPRSGATSLLNEMRALTFVLGGLSKSAGLPHLKLAWIVVSGPDGEVRDALQRLDLIADTYLSVSTPVQVAAPALIERGRRIRHAITSRVTQNLSALGAIVRAHPALTWREPEGGWAAVVRVPAVEPEEHMVLRLLHEARVLVHPGYFFDFREEAYVVLSLLPEPDVFSEGVSRLAHALSGVRS